MLKDFLIQKSSKFNLEVLKKEKMLSLRNKGQVILFPLKELLEFKNSKLSIKKKVIANKALYYTYNVLFSQAFLGLDVGYRKQLKIAGIGYSCEYNSGSHSLVFKLGLSHVVNFLLDKHIEAICPKSRLIVLKSFDKKVLHNCVQNIQKLRKPNSYKELGIYQSGVVYPTKVGKKT